CYRYLLAPWDSRFAIRARFHYSQDECRRLLAEQRERRHHAAKSRLVSLFRPLLGFLTAEDQLKLEKNYGFPAFKITASSAILELLIGGYVFILTAAS